MLFFGHQFLKGEDKKMKCFIFTQPVQHTLQRPYLWLLSLLWGYTYILFPSWMLPGHQHNSVIAMVALILFILVNIWLFYRWRFDEGISWSWSFDLKVVMPVTKDHYILVVGLFIYTVLQIYPLVVAPIGIGDTTGIALAGPHLLSPLWSIAHYLDIPVLYVRLVLIGLGAILIWCISRMLSSYFIKALWVRTRKFQVLLPVGVTVLLLLVIYAWGLSSLFLTGSQVDPAITFHREPPFGRLVLVISTLFCGGNEIAARLPQLLFLLGAIIYLYRLVLLYSNKQAAILSAFIFGLMPPVFYYTHVAYLAGGLLFFIVSSSFYFLRHFRDGAHSDLLMSLLLATAGSLYKRTAILVVAIFAVFMVLSWLYRRHWPTHLQIINYVKTGWFFLVGVAPWLIIVGYFAGPGRFIRYRYPFVFSNWLSLDLATGYLQQLPFQMSWPIAAIILLSFLYGLLVRRNVLFFYTLTWFVMYYVFFTLDEHSGVIGHDRFALVWFPAMAVWIGEFIFAVDWLKNSRLFRVGVPAVLILYLVLISTLVRVEHLNPHYASYLDARGNLPSLSSTFVKNKVDMAETRLPYGKVFEYFQSNPRASGKILVFNSRAVMQLYSYKYGQTLDLYNCINFKFDTKDELFRFSKENQISYVLVPVGHGYKSVSLEESLNPSIIHLLNNGDFEPFELIARFTHGINALLLLKVPSEVGKI
ncbi:MAG: hypothetical protein D4R45_01155 [Planctomycetaceae bacterium]|nr:MAG: hypothetical protein D4R45_01155 [Planctomycetaceae bacterium]